MNEELMLEGILGTLGLGVVVLDNDGRVQVWDAKASDLWGPRAEEVEGQRFLGLDIGLPLERLEDPIRQVQGGAERIELDLDAVNRRGRAVKCSVRLRPLEGRDGSIQGTILLMSPAEQP
jgi:two-component system CheB/CheR fusion protein